MHLVLTAEERATGTLSPERLALAVRTFRDTGVVVLENAFDLAFIAEARAAYEAQLEQHIESLGGWKALDGKTFGKRHIGFFPPLFPPLADERMAAPALAVQISERLLGEDFRCAFYHTNTAFPGSTYQAIHRDSPPLFGTEMGVPHPPTNLVLNIPFCDFTEENGSTEYWPGTHLIVDTDPEDSKRLEERVVGMAPARMNIPVGSLVLRDLRVWHRGTLNRADHPRTMMAIVWRRSFLMGKGTTIPRSTWEAWSERAQNIYRENRVVEDAEHRPARWGE